jgi:hypothetical protein
MPMGQRRAHPNRAADLESSSPPSPAGDDDGRIDALIEIGLAEIDGELVASRTGMNGKPEEFDLGDVLADALRAILKSLSSPAVGLTVEEATDAIDAIEEGIESYLNAPRSGTKDLVASLRRIVAKLAAFSEITGDDDLHEIVAKAIWSFDCDEPDWDSDEMAVEDHRSFRGFAAKAISALRNEGWGPSPAVGLTVEEARSVLASLNHEHGQWDREAWEEAIEKMVDAVSEADSS